MFLNIEAKCYLLTVVEISISCWVEMYPLCYAAECLKLLSVFSGYRMGLLIFKFEILSTVLLFDACIFGCEKDDACVLRLAVLYACEL